MQRKAPVAKRLITASVMLSVLMSTIDMTIANVALPHMRGSLSAGLDQITWVLTSYIVAQTLMTPVIGWLAARLGQKTLMLGSIAAFTIASAACGIATNLPEMVLFRIIQGLSCAAFSPVAQAILYDINEPKDHPKAMTLFGMAIMVGPLIGPLLGGWLTDIASWRLCFWINVPLGIIAFVGVQMSVPQRRKAVNPFDFLGFGALAIALAALQLLLDRGPGEDWFDSREIWIYAAIACAALHVFIVQTILGPRAFFDRQLLADRNFTLGSLLTFGIGLVAFSTLALMPMMMQSLMQLTPLQAGGLTAPRGLGMMLGMAFSTRLLRLMPNIAIATLGFLLLSASFVAMAHFTIEMPHVPIILANVVQGLGLGFVFMNVNMIVFSNVPPHLRAEAASINILARSLGSSFGVSIIQSMFVKNSSIAHAGLAELAEPNNQLTPSIGSGNTTSLGQMMNLDAEIMRQAAMISYLDAFWFCAILALVIIPFLLFLRPPRSGMSDTPHVHLE